MIIENKSFPLIFALQVPAYALFFATLLVPNDAGAASIRWFKMEVIVFSQDSITSEVNDDEAESIDWPDDLVELNRQDVSLESLPADPMPYATLEPGNSDLTSELYQMGTRSDYTPLAHFTWIQPVRANQKSKAVHLEAPGDTPGSRVDGYLRLQRGHYLHLIADFEFSKESSDFSESNYFSDDDTIGRSALNRYRIKQRRRILNKELNYFDNAYFGVITKVTPIDIED